MEKDIQTIITTNEQETRQVGEQLGSSFAGGEVIALNGDLGAGKTVLTKGIAMGMGIDAHILSPTFNIVREYHG